MARALHAARLALVVLLVPLMVFAASGWLYLVRGHIAMPGPRMAEALPLDELPGHASVPLLPFMVAWGGAGLVLGYAARAASVRLRVAAPLFGLGSGVMLGAATWFSIFVVRQIPAHDALNATLGTPAIYSAAVLVALGALLARVTVLSRVPAAAAAPPPQQARASLPGVRLRRRSGQADGLTDRPTAR